MERVEEFYRLMESTIGVRRSLVEAYLLGAEKGKAKEEIKKEVKEEAKEEVKQEVKKEANTTKYEGIYKAGADALRETVLRFQEMPRNEEGHLLFTDDQNREILIDGTYEIEELKKDLLFFEQGEKALEDHLARIHPNYYEEQNALLEFLKGRNWDAFFTDRDGTINNYCGRYRSSVQSGYNAVYLSLFAATVPRKPVVLTSAPLRDIGIADISVFSRDLYLLAGSKGREYLDFRGERKTYPISVEEQGRLDALNKDIANLLEREENRIFSFIGSGFQKKFGETALARQDMHGSVPPGESERVKEEVRQIVEKQNRGGEFFRLEDTGKDLEIILALGNEGRHFHKGDGVSFLSRVLDIPLKGKDVLICGDTSSDLPMVSRAREEGASVSTVFVASHESLGRTLGEMDVEYTLVSTPDVLVSALHHAT